MTLSTGVTKRITAGVIKHKNALEEVVRELDRRGPKVSEVARVLGCEYTTALRSMPQQEARITTPQCP